MQLLMSPDTHCSRCKTPFRVFASSLTTGYGVTPDDDKLCYRCCGDDDRKYMETHDRMTLYLTTEVSQPTDQMRKKGYGVARRWTVTNWPGSLVFNAAGKSGRHNIAGKRYDVWFTDHKGNRWHGVQYGDRTQIVHCRKLKSNR